MRLGPAPPRVRWPPLDRIVLNPIVFLLLGRVVAVYVAPHPDRITAAAAVLGAGAIAVLAWRRPIAALTVLVVFFPFQQLTQAWLFKHGVPLNQVTIVGYWKELIIVVLIAKAWKHRTTQIAGPLEYFAAGLLSLVVIYLLVPLGPDLRIRYISSRADVGYIVLFFVARMLPCTKRERDRLERVFLMGVCVIAALGFWNYFGQDGWTDWVDSTGLRQFQATLTKSTPPAAVVHTAFGSGSVVRIGSIFLSPNELAYLLLIAFAVAVSRIVRRVGGAFERVAAGLLVVCLIPTFCRSATALLVVVGLVIAAGSGRLSRGFGVIVGVVLVLVLLLGSFGDAQGQVASGFDSKDERTSEHITRLGDSVSRIAREPLGTGLGTAAAISIRFEVAGRADSPENFYFQLATEIGVVGMLLFIGFIAVLWHALWRRVRWHRDLEAVGAAAGIAALALGAIVLDVFQFVSVTWPLFAIAGLTLGRGAGDTGSDDTEIDMDRVSAFGS